MLLLLASLLLLSAPVFVCSCWLLPYLSCCLYVDVDVAVVVALVADFVAVVAVAGVVISVL